MYQNLKTYLFLGCLATFSFNSFGQDVEKQSKSRNVLDRLELEATVSFFENQQFNIVPGVGGQVSVNAPLFNGGLRLGLGVGISKLHYQFQVDSGYHDPIGATPSYVADFEMTSMNFDFLVGTDFLRKSNLDLTLDVGARLFVPFNANYSFLQPFEYRWMWTDMSTRYNFQVVSKLYPAIFGNLTFAVPINNRSALSVSYGFSLAFINVKLKSNSQSHSIFYEHEWVEENSDYDFNGYLVGVGPTPIVLDYDYHPIELPTNLYGGQHSICIGYRYSFGLCKKTE